MQLLENTSLRPYNTFGMDIMARQIVVLDDESLLMGITERSQERKVLGGGSNVLLTKPVETLLVLNRLKGINIERADENYVWARVSGGEVWHDFVLFAINNSLGGIENLALIPGTVGASPIQNIGAYGVEVTETIEEVTGWHWEEKAFVTLRNDECKFGYRDSVFKHGLKDKLLITSVLFRLSKQPDLRTTYGAITQELEAMQLEASVKNIAQAVINIRQSKLPDPKQVGNAGSFFKNPVIAVAQYNQLKETHPLIPNYPINANAVKVPAGWLIEQAGWKGYRKGDAGVHSKQALVLVNYGNATGKEIYELSSEVIASVESKYGIILEREVQMW